VKKVLILFCFGWLIIISCQQHSIPVDSQAHLDRFNHKISIDEAKSNLEEYLNYTTKSKQIKQVDKIYTLSSNTKTSEGNQLTDLIYVASFVDDGYAILSADDRVPEQVLAFSDNGTISQYELSQAIVDNGRATLSNFPITGDGIIIEEDYPNEVFMNPNTFNHYDANANDYYVGDFSYVSTLDTIQFSPAAFKVVSSLGYVTEQIMMWEGDKTSGPTEMVVKTYYKTLSRVDTTSTVLLSNLHNWHQFSPFNDNCPMVRPWLIFGTPQRAASGCFPLALAKVLTYLRHPQVYSVNGFTINWEALNTNYSLAPSDAAILLSSLGDLCGTLYFANGSFTFPGGVKSAMSMLGFENVQINNYSKERVMSQIDAGLPIIICSVPSTNTSQFSLTKSHAWNIDGYRIKTVQKHTETYIGDVLVEHKIEDAGKSYEVYCDFGWGGADNGYLVSGAFNVGEVNYNHWYLKTIDYEL